MDASLLMVITALDQLEASTKDKAKAHIEEYAKSLDLEVEMDSETFDLYDDQIELFVTTWFKTKGDALLFKLSFSIEELNRHMGELDAYVERTEWHYYDGVKETL